jgi:hypothetical protein
MATLDFLRLAARGEHISALILEEVPEFTCRSGRKLGTNDHEGEPKRFLSIELSVYSCDQQAFHFRVYLAERVHR